MKVHKGKTAGMNTTNIEIVPLEEHHIPEAASVIAEAFLDEPGTVAVVRSTPEKRLRILKKHFRMQASMGLSQGASRCAIHNGEIVAAMLITPPGKASTPPVVDMITIMVRSVFEVGPAMVCRGLRSSLDDEKHRPQEPNYFLEMLAINPHLQGQGIGSLLLSHLIEMADGEGVMVYLSTTQPRTVRLYERHGFKTIVQGKTLGVPNFHMVREAKKK